MLFFSNISEESKISSSILMFICPIFVFAVIGLESLFKLYISEEILFNSFFCNKKTVFSISPNSTSAVSVDFSIVTFFEK